MAETDQADLTSLTVQLLSAYVSNNSVPSNELAALIDTTRAALAGQPEAAAQAAPEYVAAVSLRKSLASRDHILSMIDGRPYKTLKRHLASHGFTPAEYRERYKLSANYPMVAPNYSEQRRDVAARLGLGRRPAVAKPKGGETAQAARAAAPVESTPSALQPTEAQPKNQRPKPKERARSASTKKAAPEAESAQPAERKRRAQAAAGKGRALVQPQAEQAKASAPRRRSRKGAEPAPAAG